MRSTWRCRPEARSDACTSYPEVWSERRKEREEMGGRREVGEGWVADLPRLGFSDGVAVSPLDS
jgi:hypothetical protein